jgi:hypothetical protein
MPTSTHVRLAIVVAAGPPPVRAEDPPPQPESANRLRHPSQLRARFTRPVSAGLAAACGLRVVRRDVRFISNRRARCSTAHARDGDGDAEDDNDDDEKDRGEERFNHGALVKHLQCQRAAYRDRTVTTGHGAIEMTRPATLPMSSFVRPVRPWVPITMRSLRSRFAALTICS